MPSQPKVAYDIEVIHDCIVRDTETYRKFATNKKKLSLYGEKQKLLEYHPQIKKMIDIGFIRALDKKRGEYAAKVAWMPSALIITDQRIREMCRNMFLLPKEYAKVAGIGFGLCPGLGKMSACPPFSFTAEETRRKLDDADIFIAIQSMDFIEPPKYRGWHDVMVNKLRKAINRASGRDCVTSVFGAGPCNLCFPNPCMGGGECRLPEQRVFALESSGVGVIQLCRDMALFSGDKNWEVKFSKNFGTPKQTKKDWKITFGVAVKLLC